METTIRTDETVRPRGKVLSRTAKALALVVAVLTFVGVTNTGTASAYVYAGSGQVGTSYVGQGACVYQRTNVSGTLKLRTAPPTVYARNNYAGSGNDAQRVRYRAFLVNAYTGATLASTGWSGQAWAWDNTPAAWSGVTEFVGWDYRGNYVVDYRIEWLDNSGSYVLGWQAQRFNNYAYYNQLVGPYGPISSCHV